MKTKKKTIELYFTISFIPCGLGKLINKSYNERVKLCKNYTKDIFDKIIEFINSQKYIKIMKQDTSSILLSECRLTLKLNTDNKQETTQKIILNFVKNILKENKLCVNYEFINPLEKYKWINV